jgi:uridine kinase
VSEKRVIVGIGGGSGAGKTTVVEKLTRRLDPQSVTVIKHDAYYRDLSDLPPEERAARNFDHPDALETSLLVQHLEDLRDGVIVRVPVYDFTSHTRTGDFVTLHPKKVILVDGILVLAVPELRSLLDVKVFVDADPDIRFIRRLLRDVEERGRTLECVTHQYLTTTRPMHQELVEESRGYADVIVQGGDESAVAVDLVVTTIESALRA